MRRNHVRRLNIVIKLEQIKLIGLYISVLNRISTIPHSKEIGINPKAAKQSIIAFASNQKIIARARYDLIITESATQHIIPGQSP